MTKPNMYLAADNTTPKPEEITRATVKRLKGWPDNGKDLYCSDTELPGLRLRRTPKGTITFEFRARVRGVEGRTIKETLGRATGKGAISISMARYRAGILREAVQRGVDPVETRRLAEAARKAAEKLRKEVADHRKWTVNYALEEMLKWRQAHKTATVNLRPGSVTFYRQEIKALGPLGKRPIVDITAGDIRKALGELEGVSKPNKAKTALSGVIGHAIKVGGLKVVNPVGQLIRGEFIAPKKRQGHLKKDQIGDFILWVEALDIKGKGGAQLTKRVKDYVLLSLAYGMRAQELMAMRWDYVDFERGIITLPGEFVKEKREKKLPLTEWTRRILQGRLKENVRQNVRQSEYVFPGETVDRPISSMRHHLGALLKPDEEAVRDWWEKYYPGETGNSTRPVWWLMPHDLRRTFATHCGYLGIHRSRVSVLMGHTEAGTTAGYTQKVVEGMEEDLEIYQAFLLEVRDREAHQRADPEGAKAAAKEYEENKAKTARRHWPGVD